MPMKRSLESRRMSNRLRTALLAIKEVGLHRPLALDVLKRAGLEAERIAQRLPRGGGDVNVAAATRQALGDAFCFEPRALQDVKGEGVDSNLLPLSPIGPCAAGSTSCGSLNERFIGMFKRRSYRSACRAAGACQKGCYKQDEQPRA